MNWSAKDRRQLAEGLRKARDARLQRRLLGLLRVAEGESVAAVASFLHVNRRTVHRWCLRYAQQRRCSAMEDALRTGRPASLQPEHLGFLQRTLRQDPQALGYAATCWSVPLLQEHLRQQEIAVCSPATVRRALQALDWTWNRPRYVLERDPEAEEQRAASSAG